MSGRSTSSAWFTTLSVILLSLVGLCAVGQQPELRDDQHGSAFSAYGMDVAIVVSPTAHGRMAAASPTPVPPPGPRVTAELADLVILSAVKRRLPQGRAPPRFGFRPAISLPRAPPLA